MILGGGNKIENKREVQAVEVYKGVEKEKQDVARMSAQKKKPFAGDQERRAFEMTDNDIKRALECLASGCFDCNDGCKQSSECPVNIISCALDLINRQKAEIERLTIEKDNLIRNYRQCMTEAIKEFAERLKEKATSTFYEEHKYVDTEDIDNLVKEMTEVKNNE